MNYVIVLIDGCLQFDLIHDKKFVITNGEDVKKFLENIAKV